MSKFPTGVRKINLEDFTTLDNEVLRQINESIVLNLIRERQPISRAELARFTNLMGSTVSSIVKSLIEEDLVFEATLGDSTGGRKPRMLRISGEHSMAIGVDLGVRQTTIGLSNFNGQIIHKKSLDTLVDSQRFLPQVAEEIDLIIKSRIPRGTRLAGIGVGLPGITDPIKGEIIFSSYLGWRNVAVGDILRKKLRHDLVFEGEARAAGLAELWFGKLGDLKSCHIVVVAVADEGLATAIIIGGHLYRGATSGAGEFGHVTLFPNGPRCRCGNQGCWELYVSDTATISRYLRYRGENGSENSPQGRVSELARRASEGDQAALRAIRETGKYLGMGMCNVVNTLNPEMIIVTGPISEAWDLIEPEIWGVLRARALGPSISSLRLKSSTTDENPYLMGAVSLVLCRRFMVP